MTLAAWRVASVTGDGPNICDQLGHADVVSGRGDVNVSVELGDFDLAHAIDFTPGCIEATGVFVQAAEVAGLVSQILPTEL